MNKVFTRITGWRGAWFLLVCITIIGLSLISQTGNARAADAKREAVRLGIDNIDN